MSLCQASSHIATEPFLTPSWSTAIAVSLNNLTQGITPPDAPLNPLIGDPSALILPIYIPIPPPNLDTSEKLSSDL